MRIAENTYLPPLPVPIKLAPGALIPVKAEGGDWYDLFTAQSVVVFEGEYFQVPLGVAMKLPDGYEAILAPRSSTFKKFGVLQTNSIGVIDAAYCGNEDYWAFPVYATRNCFIPKHTRLCQFRIIEHQPSMEFVEVEELKAKNRGGFGSTGD